MMTRIKKYKNYRQKIAKMTFYNEEPSLENKPFDLPDKEDDQSWEDFTKIIPQDVLRAEIIKKDEEEKLERQKMLKKYLQILGLSLIVLLLTIFIVIAIILSR